MKKIWQVVDVSIKILESFPPQLFVTASGVVTSSGWSNPLLIPYYYFLPPEDGIYEFYFVAKPPSGTALTVITPIIATFIWEELPEGVRGVKVNGSTGKPQIAMIDTNFSEVTETLTLVWHRPGFGLQ